jgi:dTDP-4-amino-4,6-dideoxygalactose transaminase
MQQPIRKRPIVEAAHRASIVYEKPELGQPTRLDSRGLVPAQRRASNSRMQERPLTALWGRPTPSGGVLAYGVPSESHAILPGQGPAPGVPMVDFRRQYDAIRQEALAAIAQVCDRQQFILGPAAEQFEQASSAWLGAQEAVGCASGTDALWLVLAAAGVGPGASVLTTPFSFFASVSCILRAGATPVLADIDPRTFNLSPDQAAQAVARHSGLPIRAILPVHLYGQCADWDGFSALRERLGVLLLEDAAQAFGAAWRGRRAGALGDLAAFSFYPTKNLSAFGDAGMVSTSNPEFAERARMLRNHGMRRRYFHDETGWNSRLDGIQAAVLSVKLRYVDAWNEQRRARAAAYDALFRAAGLAEPGPYPERGAVLPWVDPRGTHIFHQYVIRVRRRDALRAFLSARGIGSEVYYPVPLHRQQALASLGYAPDAFPESQRAADEVLALPMFPELTTSEQEQVTSAIAAFLS